jgi:fumarate hydratase class II
MSGFRVEHDTMGEVRVPAEALWRAQTQRAVENFPISGRGMERAQIRALGLVKGAAARVNARIGVLSEDLAVMSRNVLESTRLLAAVARLLADKVVDGAQVDEERTREYAESSPSIVTPLNRYLGYEEAASIAKQSLAHELCHIPDGARTPGRTVVLPHTGL